MDASPEERLREAGAHASYSSAPQRRAISMAECTVRRDAAYLVKGLIRPMDLILFVGEPGAGKSVVVPLLAHRVANGAPFFRHRTQAGPVLYVAAEAGQDMRERFAALREQHGPAAELHLWPYPMDLLTQGSPDLDALLMEARRLRAKLIIVDTLPSAFPGLEENEALPMGRVRDTLRRLGRETGAAVVAVHHPAKGGETSRGHGNLRGDAEVEFFVRGTSDGERTVTMNKNRNGTSAGSFAFTVSTVDLGEDSDGDRIIRPVAIEEGYAAGKAARRGPHLNETHKAWLADLESMFATPDRAEERVPLPGMGIKRTLSRDQVREGLRVKGRFILDHTGSLTTADRGKMRDVLNALSNKGRIGMTHDLVWLLNPGACDACDA